MALTVIGFICCTLVMLFSKHGKSCWWGIMRMSYFFALLSQMFTYSVFATKICKEFNGEETLCLAGANGVVGSFNVLVLLALTIFSCIVPAPCHPMFRVWYSQDPEKEAYDTDKMDEDLPGVAQEQSSDDSEHTMAITYPSETSQSVAQSRRSAEQPAEEDQSSNDSERGMIRTHPFEVSQSVAQSRRSAKQPSVANSRRSEKESVNNKSRKSRSSGIIADRSVKTIAKSKATAKSRQYIVRPKHPEPESHQSNGSSSHDNSTLRTVGESRRSKASKKESNANNGLEADDIIEIVEEYDPPSVTGSFDRGDGFTVDDTEIIKFRTEYGPEGKKQIKEVTHGDGSRTVTTWIDPMGHDEDVEINTLPSDDPSDEL